MRTTIFVFLLAMLSMVCFLNIISIGAGLAKNGKIAARFVTLGINVTFMLSVIYLYNTSYGD